MCGRLSNYFYWSFLRHVFDARMEDASVCLSLLDRSTYSPTNRETAQNERKQANRPNNKVLLKTAIKKDQQGGGKQHIFATTLSKKCRVKDETRLKIRCQCRDLSNSQGNQDTAILDQHTEDSSNTADTREQKT